MRVLAALVWVVVVMSLSATGRIVHAGQTAELQQVERSGEFEPSVPVSTLPEAGENAQAFSELSEEARWMHLEAELMAFGLEHPDPGLRAMARFSRPSLQEPGDSLADWYRDWLRGNPGQADRVLLARLACADDAAWLELCAEQALWQQWADAEPGNAQPWLLVAWRAQVDGNQALLARALEQLSTSQYVDTGERSTLKLARRWVRGAVGGSLPGNELAAAVFNVAIGLTPPARGYTAICPTGTMEPIRTDRLEVCRRVAALLTESRDGMQLPFLIGLAVAKAYANTESERNELHARKDQAEAVYRAFLADKRLTTGLLGEGESDAYARYLDLVVEQGERQAMIDWLARAPAEQGQ